MLINSKGQQVKRTDAHVHLGHIDPMFLALQNKLINEHGFPRRRHTIQVVKQIVTQEMAERNHPAARERVTAKAGSSLNGLLNYMRNHDIDRSVILSDNYDMMAHAIIAADNEGREILPFLWVRDIENLPESVPEWLSGLKLHPLKERFTVGTEDLKGVIDFIERMPEKQRKGFTLLVHSEDKETELSPADGYSRFAEAVYPNEVLIGHAGAFGSPKYHPDSYYAKSHGSEVQDYQAVLRQVVRESIDAVRGSDNLSLEISCMASPYKQELIVEALKDRQMKKRVFLGSDYPLLVGSGLKNLKLYATLSSQEDFLVGAVGADTVYTMYKNADRIKAPTKKQVRELREYVAEHPIAKKIEPVVTPMTQSALRFVDRLHKEGKIDSFRAK